MHAQRSKIRIGSQSAPREPRALATSRKRKGTVGWVPPTRPRALFQAAAAARVAMGAPEEAAPAADVEAPPAPPPKPPAVPFREVLRTADALDVVLMITGTICGAACGAVQPWCGARCSLTFRGRLLGASGPRRGRSPSRASRRGTLLSPAACCGAAARSGAPCCVPLWGCYEPCAPRTLRTHPTAPLRPGCPTAARRAARHHALRAAPPRAPQKTTRRAEADAAPAGAPRAPSFTLIFGSLVDTLGSGATMSESLRPVILWFCYLGGAAAARQRPKCYTAHRRFARRSRCVRGRLPGDCVLGDGRHPAGQPHQARAAARGLPDLRRLHACSLARCGTAP